MLPDWSLDLDLHPKAAAPLGFGPFGQRPPLPANDQGSTLSRTVSDDLQAIFAEAPPPPTSRRSGRVRSVGAQPRAATSGGSNNRITAWGGVIAAAVAGVVVGTIVVKQPPKAPAPPAAVIAQAPSARALAPAPEPATPSVAPAPTPTAKAAPERKPPAIRRAPSRSTVLAADRELRQAYAAASRAGVARGHLVSVRNRWVALRDDPPARLVAGYGALARDLRQQAAKSHHRKRGLFG